MNHLFLVLIAATANVFLNLFLQKGGKGLNTSSIKDIIISILLSPWMWAAVLSAFILLSAFVAAVRVHSLSLTYTAVTALAMVALTTIGFVFHQEPYSHMRVFGLILILVGLVLSAVAVHG